MIQFVFENFPRVVQLSEKARPVYYFKHKKVPEHILNKVGVYYDWDEEDRLYDIETKQLVLKNKNEAGKPKVIAINGNLLWDLGSKSIRELNSKQAKVAKIKRFLVDYFITEIGKQVTERIVIPQEKFPVKINFYYHINDHYENPDQDNLREFYEKSFFDAIQFFYYPSNNVKKREKVPNHVGFIKDDSLKYVMGGESLVFVFQGLLVEKLYIEIV